MLLYKKNPKSIIEIRKEAPKVGAPYVVSGDEASKFYENDPAMNQIVGGYSRGAENSYAKELMKKYPLGNE